MLGDIRARVLFEIDKMFPKVNRKYISWRQAKTLKHYVLVVVSRNRGNSLVSDTRFLAFDTSGNCLHLGSTLRQTSTEGFLALLEKEGLRVDERNIVEVVELFDLMHPQKRIVNSAGDLKQPDVLVRKDKVGRIRVYGDVIQSPLFVARDKSRVIRFWTIDFWTGALEQWDVIGNCERIVCIESKLLEAKLISVLL